MSVSYDEVGTPIAAAENSVGKIGCRTERKSGQSSGNYVN